MKRSSVDRLELGLATLGPLALLGIASTLGGAAALAFLGGSAISLAVSGFLWGADSRDGHDWHRGV